MVYSVARYELCSALYIAAKFKIQKGGREIFDNLIYKKKRISFPLEYKNKF